MLKGTIEINYAGLGTYTLLAVLAVIRQLPGLIGFDRVKSLNDQGRKIGVKDCM